MSHINKIRSLKSGERYIISENDFSRIEVWYINFIYFLFEVSPDADYPIFFEKYESFEMERLIEQLNHLT